MSNPEWQIEASITARNTVNPIRQIVDLMKLEHNPDKKLIKLTIGDPTVFGNLKTANECVDAALEVTKSAKYNGYSNSVGYEEARQAVAEYSCLPKAPVTTEDVILSSGCSQAIDLVLTLLANPGDNILVPMPGFPIYRCLAESMGVTVKNYKLLPEQSWEIDLDDLESQIDNKTKVIVVNSPSNPCGAVFSRVHIEQILGVASRHKIPILSDEVYEHVVFSGVEHYSFAQLSVDVPIFSVSAISKRFLLPGWRLGWVIVHDRGNVLTTSLRRSLAILTQRILGPCSLAQGALPAILKNTPDSLFEHCNQVYEGNAKASFEILSSTPGLKPVCPSGAMYMMVGIELDHFPGFTSDVEFTEKLMNEESVFCLPATAFSYPGYFRVVLCIPQEKITEAFNRIKAFCSRHYE